MNKCTTCGMNLYPISKDPESKTIGTPLHDHFNPEVKSAEKFFDKYNLNDCCRNQLLTYIPAQDLTRLIPNGLNK